MPVPDRELSRLIIICPFLSSTGVFPSRPPAHVEQQKRQRLQRQKEIQEIQTLYHRSTSDSLPDESTSFAEIVSNNKTSNFTKFSNKSSSTDSGAGQNGATSAAIHKRRPVLQRQQRQSSEDTEVSSLRGNVHFKEDPEYFEAVQKNARGQEQRSSQSEVVITANAAGGAVGPAPAVVKNNMVSGGVGDEIKISSNQLLQPNFKSTAVTSSHFLQNRSQQGKYYVLYFSTLQL